MTNYTMNTYEVKREILNFSEKMSDGLLKPSVKFINDMQYGIAKGGSALISEIARALKEENKLISTIERLCDNLRDFSSEETEIVMKNYHREVSKYFGDEPIVIYDDSDVNKEYARKMEDLDRVRDGSSRNDEIVNGYNVCEAVILTEKQRQPISVYSKIYSCESNGFISKNQYTKESIVVVNSILKRPANHIFDRGYDDNKIYEKIDSIGGYFVVRLKDNRNLEFKGKKRNCKEVANERKGKVVMKLDFCDDKVEVYISHTKAVLPNNKREYKLVTVYGLSDEPMMLLTNRDIKNKEDAIKVVWLYMRRWNVEEYFRAKKQEYDFENYRVRKLNAMNVLNLMITIRMGHLAILAEKMDKNLLSIKIVYESNSLRQKVGTWFYQLSKGIKNILQYAKTGIEKHKKIRPKYMQLSLL